jgi:hypothetical protein
MILTDEEAKTGTLAPDRMRDALRTFRDAGVLVLENAYPREFIATVRAAYDAELERFIAARGGLKAMEGKTFGKNHIGFFPYLRPPVADARIAAHPAAVRLLTEVLGADLQCSFFHTNTAFPDSGFQPVHRDSGHLFGTELPVAHPPVSVVINIPLCDFTVENGSTEYWPGSHLIVDVAPEDAKQLDARAAGLPSARLNVPAGSLVLRDLRVWHRGMPNPSQTTRTMMAIVYTRGWLAQKTVTVPQSTWDGWTDEARHVYRKNAVVPDAEHRPISWEELRASQQ